MRWNNSEFPYTGRTKWGDPWEAQTPKAVRDSAAAGGIVTSPVAVFCIPLCPLARQADDRPP